MICPESQAKRIWDDHHNFVKTGKVDEQQALKRKVKFDEYKCKCGKTYWMEQ